MRLGVDTGGTFTDFVWPAADGRLLIHKQLSTPTDPSIAILDGIHTHQIGPQTQVVHGSTVATNALLERRGARTALLTTKGFADVLAIGRQNRPDIYALVPQKPAPFVPRQWRFEVEERISAQGEVLQALRPETLQPILAALAAEQIESIAVSLLFSFLYPAHEEAIRALLRQSGLADLHISLSSEILPEYREYERTSTTVINAYVAPLMERYLGRLAVGLAGRPLTVMQSNGGIINAQTAADQAARTALSGPAGGVVGAMYVAAQAGYEDIITFDMGGTSTDVALCHGRLPTTTEGSIAGMPLRLPIIDIHTVGAGGGSIALVDAGGALHVGPQSAGADPGPACYGRQQTDFQATVTDANLVLGRLDAAHFLGGEMPLHLPAAEAALKTLATAMAVESPAAAAWGLIQVANANMERAIRRISVERGYDPRLFTLVPFGGAGSLHACELAQQLQIPRVLIPPVPGVLSAMGMLVAAPTKDYSLTVMKMVTADESDIAAWLLDQFSPLKNRAAADMKAEGIAEQEIAYHTFLDMRYQGQSHELTIPFKEEQIEAESAAARFHQAHETRYGYQQAEAAVEIVTIRLTAVAPVTPPSLQEHPLVSGDGAQAVFAEKPVWFAEGPLQTSLIDRPKLRPGQAFNGPAIIFQYDTTIVVPPHWQATVDRFSNLILVHQAH